MEYKRASSVRRARSNNDDDNDQIIVSTGRFRQNREEEEDQPINRRSVRNYQNQQNRVRSTSQGASRNNYQHQQNHQPKYQPNYSQNYQQVYNISQPNYYGGRGYVNSGRGYVNSGRGGRGFTAGTLLNDTKSIYFSIFRIYI